MMAVANAIRNALSCGPDRSAERKRDFHTESVFEALTLSGLSLSSPEAQSSGITGSAKTGSGD
jgi:hypothetical protein